MQREYNTFLDENAAIPPSYKFSEAEMGVRQLDNLVFLSDNLRGKMGNEKIEEPKIFQILKEAEYNGALK